MDVIDISVAKKYTDDTVAGAGAVAGKPCQIQSITDITGGHRVTFLWVDNSSVSHTSTMDVMDGEKGDDGLGIKSVAVNSSNHLIVTYDDDTTEDAGEITLDTSDFVQKSSTAGLLKNDGTVDTTDYTVVSYTQTYSQSGQKIGEITIDGTTTDVVAPTGGGSEHGIPSGGTSGQILSKKSSTDYDVQWTDAGTASQEQADWNEADSSKVDYIKNKPNNLVQDANYVHTDYNYDATAKGKVDGMDASIAASQNGSTALTKATVGWTGKNLLPIGINGNNNGITYVVNADGSITANGTATATSFWAVPFTLLSGSYILTGCPSGGGNNTYALDFRDAKGGSGIPGLSGDSGNGSSFTLNETLSAYLNIRIASGYVANNLTFYPMLRSASISDSTFEPYHESVEEWGFPRSEQRVLGAKNLLPNTATTQTINGVTFTVNADGSVTVNGAATAQAVFSLYHENQSCPYIGKAILSGCPSGGSGSTFDLRITDDSVSSNTDYGDGVNIGITSTGSWTVAIMIMNGYTANNLIFKPIIRLASDPDSTYVPYAMTNRELTDAVSNIPTVSVSHSGTASSTTARKQQITVNNVAYDVDGSAYMEQEVILSTSADTVVTFTNNELIVDGKMFTVATSIWDLVPTSIVTSTGSCVITLPKQTNAATIGVRLYVR